MKRGIYSLILYILYVLGGIGCAVTCKILADNNTDGGWENLGYALLIFFGLIFAMASILPLLFKIIHLASGLGFFAVLCMILDVVFVGFFIYVILENLLGNASDYDNIIICAVPALLSLLSIVSNIRSIRG